MQSAGYNASNNVSAITVTIPTDDCYVIYGVCRTVANGVGMRQIGQTSFSPSTGVEPVFEAYMNTSNLIGLYHCTGMANQSLTIDCGLSVYRCSATVYY